MNECIQSELLVFICHQCISAVKHLPHQWTQDGIHVRAFELPCSGKTDTQYLFHALEGGARGILVVTCPEGECRLSQGNYRADVRVRTVQRLLAEIGLEPERATLLRCGPHSDIEGTIRGMVKGFCALGESPLAATCGD